MNMKKRILSCFALIFAGALALLAGCGGGLSDAEELGAPNAKAPLSYSEAKESGTTLRAAAQSFAARFSAEAVKGEQENVAVSPVSVYLALGLAAECASGGTREELLSVLGADYTALKAEYSDFYRSVIAEYTTNTGDVSARVDAGNSIWIDSAATAKSDCISSLSEHYLCYSYAADFRNETEKANAAVRDFVKQQTNGLIDQDFGLSKDTLFALINTLYLKEVWNDRGDDLRTEPHTFTAEDGTQTPVELLQGYYAVGRAYEAETFTHFFTETCHGYKIKFLLPKEGHTAEEVFTAENLALVNGMTDYRAEDSAAKERYSTRCLFPGYTAEYDKDVRPILQKFGVNSLFTEACEFDTLTSDDVYCEKVQHVAKLEVTKKGIEGAAVTVMDVEGESAPDESYTTVRADFVLDRPFGFLLTDRLGTVLFSGIVKTV